MKPASTTRSTPGVAQHSHKFCLGLRLQPRPELSRRKIGVRNGKLARDIENRRVDHIRDHYAALRLASRPRESVPESRGNCCPCPIQEFQDAIVSLVATPQLLDQSRRRIARLEWDDPNLRADLLQRRALLRVQRFRRIIAALHIDRRLRRAQEFGRANISGKQPPDRRPRERQELRRDRARH